MARASIELPCGCVLTETSVLAMCFPHDRELREKAAGERRETDEVHANLRATIEGLGE
jgi:hypothetical protein